MAAGTKKIAARHLSFALVLALHAAIVIVLLQTKFADAPPRERDVEIPMYLEQLPPPKAAPSAKPGGGTPGSLGLPLPDFRNPSPSPNALDLGQMLSGCQVENLDQLTAEQRAKCARATGFNYARFADQPLKLVPPPGPEKLRNSDIAARERNTADPCLIAKQSGTECIHTIIYGKGLP